MNRTALSVIGLAVGAVLIIGLFNIYKPAVKHVSHDVFDKVHIGNLEEGARPGEKEYAGMYYLNHGNGNIEFTHGKLTDDTTNHWGHFAPYQSKGLLTSDDTPTAIRNAKTIKFDDVDVQATHLDDMFGYDHNLTSIDLGNNFDTSNVNNSGRGFDSMFDLDSNLTKINLGDKFNASHVDKYHMDDMFANIPMSTKITGKATQGGVLKFMLEPSHRGAYPYSNNPSGNNHYPYSTDKNGKTIWSH